MPDLVKPANILCLEMPTGQFAEWYTSCVIEAYTHP